ncbi:MAG: hypothetical protein DLM73_13265 [Chthoniobacterales bacterium]|nr:MAG: hypothetical protein DLM73_13265 [Chthoniobacterales bacterium]
MNKNALQVVLSGLMVSAIATGAASQSQPSAPQVSEQSSGKLDRQKILVQFRLSEGGGTINFESRDPRDIANRDAIRRYGKALLAELRRGEFELLFRVVPANPLFVERAKKTGGVEFSVTPAPAGIQVEMSSSNEGARHAIHDFIRVARGDIVLTPEERSMVHPGTALGRDAQPLDPGKY